MSEFLHTPKGEKKLQALGVLLLGLGAFLLVCLISYSPLDPPNSSRSVAESLNWGGWIGAYVSYGAFVGMGRLAAYVWPVLLLLWGWNRVRCQPVALAVQRSVGLLLMAVFISVATGLPDYSTHTAYARRAGNPDQFGSPHTVPREARVGGFAGRALCGCDDFDPRSELATVGVARLWFGGGLAFARAFVRAVAGAAPYYTQEQSRKKETGRNRQGTRKET